MAIDSDREPRSEARRPRRIEYDHFVSLIVRNDRRIRSFLATLMARTDDIDEVMQKACLVAWKKIATFSFSGERADDEFFRWLCTIGRYEVMSMRRLKRESKLVFSSELVDQLADLQFEEESELDGRRKALASCMQRLRDRDREMVRQRYEMGKAAPDIASSFDVGEAAVFKALRRIRTTLLDCMERTMRREEYR